MEDLKKEESVPVTQENYKRLSFLFTAVMTAVIIVGFLIVDSIMGPYKVNCLIMFIPNMVLVVVKTIIMLVKNGHKFEDVMSELEILSFSALCYLPFLLIWIFDINTYHIVLSYLMFLPASIVLCFLYLGLKT